MNIQTFTSLADAIFTAPHTAAQPATRRQVHTRHVADDADELATEDDLVEVGDLLDRTELSVGETDLEILAALVRLA